MDKLSLLKPTLNCKGRIFYKEITQYMRMDICYDKIPVFTCGIDILETKDNNHIIVSTSGIFGRNFYEFVSNYLKLYKTYKDFKYILLQDDNFDEKKIKYINDPKLIINILKL